MLNDVGAIGCWWHGNIGSGRFRSFCFGFLGQFSAEFFFDLCFQLGALLSFVGFSDQGVTDQRGPQDFLHDVLHQL